MSRFKVIGRAKAQKIFDGLILSYCSLSSAIKRVATATKFVPRTSRLCDVKANF